MKERQNLIMFTLEAVPRPGSRETRVKCLPDAKGIRNIWRTENEQ